MHRLKVSFSILYITYILLFEDLTPPTNTTGTSHGSLVPRTNLIGTDEKTKPWLQPGKQVSQGMCPRKWENAIEDICDYRGERVDCEEYIKSSKTARINYTAKCKILSNCFKHEHLKDESDGNWNNASSRCEQIFDTVDTNIAFSVTSELTEPGKLPWQIAYYSKLNSDKYDQICSGTLIHSKIIISAAHSLWDVSTKSIGYDKSKFIVSVGRSNRVYYANNETFQAKTLNISKIDIPSMFDGGWNQKSYQDVQSNVLGVVSGWGNNDTTGFYSPYLRSVQLTLFERDTKKIKENVKIAGDTLCVETDCGKNLSKGDSDGGFVAFEVVNKTLYYHLWGVVRSGISSNSDGRAVYDSNLIQTITNVQNYKQLINDAIDKAYSAELRELKVGNLNEITAECLVPTTNLILTDTETKSELLPGIVVPQFTSVYYSCSSKYVLEGAKNNTCNVYWRNAHPKCIRMCPPIQEHSIEAYCDYNGEKVTCEDYVKPGTIAKINCAILHEKLSPGFEYQHLHCEENGKWNDVPFKCVQICGTLDTNVAFSINSEITEPTKVPWHVAIYSKLNSGKYEHICGGTLIHSKIVISAAHCFWDQSKAVKIDKSQFIVAVGKLYRDYYASNETLEVQKLNVSKIDIPVTFYGAHHDYANDIAVLTLEDHVNYKSHIRPACLSWKSENDRYIESNHTGLVAGWGITNKGIYSPDLHSVELISIDRTTCKTKKISKNDNIAGDKFCVETSNGKNVCPGDSGGGYVVSETIGSAKYYNLWGVVSNGIISKRSGILECNSNFITTFTNVQFYRQLIRDAIFNTYKII